MAENTKIEWCDHTFNPWEGCTKVGPGCDNCYAETRNARFAGGLAPNWGPGAETQIPVSQILALTPHEPLFGHKSGKRERTHWMTFMKVAADG